MSSTLRLLVTGRVVRAELVNGGRPLWAGEAPCESPDGLKDAIVQLTVEIAAKMAVEPTRFPALRRLSVTLGSPPLQVRTLRGLPPVRGRELRALVAAQATRYFRRNGHPLVTDACWPDRKSRRGGVACAVAADEPWIDGVFAGAATAGLRVLAIRPDPCSGALAGMSLLSSSERHRRAARAQTVNHKLAWTAVATWVAVAALLGGQFVRERSAIETEIAQLEAPARAVAQARLSLDGAAAMVGALEAAERERHLLLARLGALALLLPDSAYLTSLALDLEGSGALSGVARHAAEAIARLETGGALISPRPLGPVTSELDGGRAWERFSLQFGAGDRP